MKLTFSSPVATAKFSKFAGILSAAFSLYTDAGFCWRKKPMLASYMITIVDLLLGLIP